MFTISCTLVLGLSACQSAKEVFLVGEAAEKNPGPCPEAFALYETSRIVNFNGEESFSDVGFTAEIEKVRSLCRYYGDNPINADLSIDIAFGRGPAAIGQTGVYNYYVAVTRKNIDVMNKEIFPISITFPVGVDVVRATETIKEIIIPRANEGTSGANFEIIVGFELTSAQVAFNADGKRFRVSAGQD
ncbi:MAG: hypothetical protein JKX72_11780 [Robiginitomaculum sp.]|nr:hypothetical protein [Robiginitomaculum sp.]